MYDNIHVDLIKNEFDDSSKIKLLRSKVWIKEREFGFFSSKKQVLLGKVLFNNFAITLYFL